MLSLLAVAINIGAVLAQTAVSRPSNATICDWYTIQRYGANTTETQGKMMQSVVALAFAGKGDIPNINPEITGILNPGVFENTAVHLLPWFNGSIDSTNLNNQPVGIDWLDGGGTAPLYAFLRGDTDTVQIEEKTNEYRLFAHFFRAFSFVFGCTQPPPRIKGETGAPISAAYVHKFMNLNQTHLGHFINQLTLSAVHFGFSVQDSNTLESQMNARYNVRCAPGITTNPAFGPQLFSLCQNESCPLAAPVADCDAYTNLQPNGSAGGASGSGGTASINSSPTSAQSTSLSASATPSTTSTSSITPSPSASDHPPHHAPALAAGPIAGIAIGGAALLLGFISLLVYLLRKRRTSDATVHNPGFGGPPSNPSYINSPYSATPASPYGGYEHSQATTDAHMSYMSNSTYQNGTLSPHAELWSPPPVEMGGNEYGYGQKSPEMMQAKTKAI